MRRRRLSPPLREPWVHLRRPVLAFTLSLTLAACLIVVVVMGVGALLPAGGQIVFASPAAGDMNLYLLDVQSHTVARITYDPGDEAHPDWSPDGESLAYVMDIDGTPSLVRQRLLCPDRLTTCDRKPQILTAQLEAAQPDWSPDGKWIAFQMRTAESQRHQIARLPVDCQAGGCIPQPLTLQVRANQLQPNWSPDGQWIAFAGDLDESFNTDLYRVPVACFEACAGGVEQVFGGLTLDLYPQWSPDGRHLAFNYTMRSRMRVGVIDLVNRGATRRVDTGFDWVEMPAWSPQGDRLALVIYRRQQGDLYVFRLDCEGDPRRCLTRLTRDRWVEVAPAWRP